MTYEIMDANRKVYTMDDETPERAMIRVADLYQVTVIAWRYPRTGIHVGIPYGA